MSEKEGRGASDLQSPKQTVKSACTSTIVVANVLHYGHFSRVWSRVGAVGMQLSSKGGV